MRIAGRDREIGVANGEGVDSFRHRLRGKDEADSRSVFHRLSDCRVVDLEDEFGASRNQTGLAVGKNLTIASGQIHRELFVSGGACSAAITYRNRFSLRQLGKPFRSLQSQI